MQNKIWKKLLREELVTKTYDEEHKLFAVNIYKNNMEYLQNLLSKINKDMFHDLFFVAAAFSNISVLSFLYNKFEIDVNYLNKYGSTYLMIACCYNKSAAVVKYFIEAVGMDVNLTNNFGNNCLLLASKNKSAMKIIKYLTEDCKMKIITKQK
jgi:ankyrin repeat protein